MLVPCINKFFWFFRDEQKDLFSVGTNYAKLTFINSWLSLSQAKCNGVFPFSSSAVMIAPALIKMLVQEVSPSCCATKCSGVSPAVFFVFGSTLLPDLNINDKISDFPWIYIVRVNCLKISRYSSNMNS